MVIKVVVEMVQKVDVDMDWNLVLQSDNNITFHFQPLNMQHHTARVTFFMDAEMLHETLDWRD